MEDSDLVFLQDEKEKECERRKSSQFEERGREGGREADGIRERREKEDEQ